jgi:hypothetical protein
VRNALRITATNVATIVIDVDRAGLTCGAALAVETDGRLTVVLRGRSCQRVARYGG